MMVQSQPRPLTGRKVLVIVVSAFSIIVTVNLVMAYFAVNTFPGLEVRNSYVSSQGFNDRLARQRALGWETDAAMQAGVLTLQITGPDGAPAAVETITAILGRPTTERDDRTVAFTRSGDGFVATIDADYGNWDLRFTAVSAEGVEFSQRIGLIHRR